jgi:polar amino acid transport system substrate-binding protein
MLASGLGSATAEPAPGTPDRPLLVVHGEAGWTERGPDGKPVFVTGETLELVAARAGIAVREEMLPWSRAQAMVRDGRADLLTTQVTPERKAYALFTTHPIFRDARSVLYRVGSPEAARLSAVRSVAELRGLTFVAFLGDGWAAHALVGERVSWVKDDTVAAQMVAAGHAQAFLENLSTGFRLVATPELSDRVAIEPLADEEPLVFRIGIRRSLPECQALVDRFDAAIEAVTRDGSLPAIWRRYGAADG